MIEPMFGNTKFNRAIDRFQRRGRCAVRSEWRLITATHNLLKLHTHQLATVAALTDTDARTRPQRTHPHGLTPSPTRRHRPDNTPSTRKPGPADLCATATANGTL
jgi:hypothetical protein